MMDSRHEEGDELGTSADVYNGPSIRNCYLQNEYLAAEDRMLRAHLPADCDCPIPNVQPLQKSEAIGR